jgi:stage IV sporulation protein B
MKRNIKFIAGSINVVILFVLTFIIYFNVTLPNDYTIVKGEINTIKGNKNVTIDVNNLISDNNLELENLYVREKSHNKFRGINDINEQMKIKTICTNLNTQDHDSQDDPVEFGVSGLDDFEQASTGDDFETFLRAYNIFPIKQVHVHTVDKMEVYPCGIPFGIKMFTKGVMVVGMGEVEKGVAPSRDAGLKLGDMIISINNTVVYNNDDVARILNNSQGNEVLVKVIRNDMEHLLRLTPYRSQLEEAYKAGMWVRNSTAGIGTLTFYREDGFFGGLGHPVCDVDTGQIMPLLSGEIIGVNISGITKGEIGYPGELKGEFTESKNLGLLTKNTVSGVYGRLTDMSVLGRSKKIPVAMRQEIKEGPAKILSTIEGTEPKYYDVMIQRINYNNANPCKNMIVRITDKELIEKTGGIVQGMSGSPIIQNGKMVGAITHVFVNQPLKGYAIFAENMFDKIPQIN